MATSVLCGGKANSLVIQALGEVAKTEPLAVRALLGNAFKQALQPQWTLNLR